MTTSRGASTRPGGTRCTRTSTSGWHSTSGRTTRTGGSPRTRWHGRSTPGRRMRAPVTEPVVRTVALRDVPPNRRRGGDIRLLLGPKTVGSTSGFFGVLRLEPGERVSEHYHPYSEEFLYVVSGRIRARL